MKLINEPKKTIWKEAWTDKNLVWEIPIIKRMRRSKKPVKREGDNQDFVVSNRRRAFWQC